ncbi:ribonuclease P protein subunit p40-like [Penaeus chinensis]|uniref:ribonuclease P protein subunit p40-like n=1 Tax=Penaeus chinensis TaxID=139456 RepID=UPI001FB59A5F|nr:ribonuclease P protein subunit p40-like [Penaeus chinensis]XP_047491401.1 ribonuclease P protein subunit p40-like [Penaeus chinensis]XP_047491402.1 ribonuclease P protein subunit p40-like [Penaeus chinensis]XP_047491403.1 ribonuclease P protein subunit p40-like [Penaeus chinensis]
MLNPEVIKFPAPKSQLTYTHHTWDDPKRNVTWQHIIQDHTFNTKVVMLLPDTPIVPNSLSDSFTVDAQHYLVKNLPLAEFCTPVFLQAFRQKGHFHALCCDTRIDVDNTAAMTPDGYLHILVDKFTYQELQLHGTLSSHILRKPQDRYVIKINTNEKTFRPGKSYYERVTSALGHPRLKFNFWITWKPKNGDICPSSVAKYFHDLGFAVEEQFPDVYKSIASEVAMPRLDKSQEDEVEELEPEDLLEWIGCQSLGIRLGTDPSSMCELVRPKAYDMVSNVNAVHCTGFFTPEYIVSLVSTLRSWLLERSPTSVPWLSVTVYGHPDSPVSWGHQEHSYRSNGDNFYTLVLQRDGVHVFKVFGSTQPLRMYPKANNNK